MKAELPKEVNRVTGAAAGVSIPRVSMLAAIDEAPCATDLLRSFYCHTI
jgi:hypothetical protein